MRTATIDQSRGHIAIIDCCEYGVFELFRRGGDIYRAPVHNPVMTDGYRCGRWEGPDRADTHRYLSAVYGVTVA